jgi:hypothetical protein
MFSRFTLRVIESSVNKPGFTVPSY